MGAQDKLVADLAKALGSARRLMQEEYDGLLAYACPRDCDGNPVVSKIDGEARTLARRYKRVLKQIDQLLT
jgi:hypothetical protein